MKTLFKLIILAALLAGAYLYFVPGASLSDFTGFLPKRPRLDAATGKPLIPCLACKTTGQVKCAARGCVEGKVECNGPCLRLTKGTWIKDAKLGHGPDELWMPFRQTGGTQYWSKAHVGEVVEMRDGKAVLTGACKVCGGTTRLPCKVCQGTDLVTCQICKGRKEIPDMKAVSAQDAGKPVAAEAPVAASSSPPPPARVDVVRLKNGKTIAGKIVIRDVKVVYVRTSEGKTIEVPIKDLEAP